MNNNTLTISLDCEGIKADALVEVCRGHLPKVSFLY